MKNEPFFKFEPRREIQSVMGKALSIRFKAPSKRNKYSSFKSSTFRFEGEQKEISAAKKACQERRKKYEMAGLRYRTLAENCIAKVLVTPEGREYIVTRNSSGKISGRVYIS